jgi:hypothetical protein
MGAEIEDEKGRNRRHDQQQQQDAARAHTARLPAWRRASSE